MEAPKKKQRLGTKASSNEYTGFTLQPAVALQTIDANEEPESFYKRFVARREPVMIRGHIQDPSWRGSQWTNDYLKSKAGHVKVRVEHRADAHGRFGQGRERWMTFGAFLDHISAGNDLLYLTTQELGHGMDGRPDIISPPVTALTSDFPMRPRIAGGLVPQNLNLWMGHNTRGPTTTGLHHDFHDNLYILLRGIKTFRLYSPADAEKMYVAGDLSRVHPNGRINYRQQPTRADGADLGAERALAADHQRIVLELEMAAAGAAAAAGEAGAAERMAAAEKRLEEALEEILEAECEREDCGDGGTSDDSDEDDSDGDSGSGGGGSGNGGGNGDGGKDDDSGSGSDEEPITGEALAAALGFSSVCAGGGIAAVLGAGQSVEGIGKADGGAGGAGGGGGNACGSSSDGGRSSDGGSSRIVDAGAGTNGQRADGRLPDNFSRVDLSISPQELRKRFPEFAAAVGTTVELQAGQMLYLPAGWFHEVTSTASADGHLALNYWFHCPDAGAGGSAAEPYTSAFWQQDWETRERDGAFHCAAD